MPRAKVNLFPVSFSPVHHLPRPQCYSARGAAPRQGLESVTGRFLWWSCVSKHRLEGKAFGSSQAHQASYLSTLGINAAAINYKSSCCCSWTRKACVTAPVSLHLSQSPTPPYTHFLLAPSPQNCQLRFPWLPMLHPLVTLRILCHCSNLFPASQQ